MDDFALCFIICVSSQPFTPLLGSRKSNTYNANIKNKIFLTRRNHTMYSNTLYGKIFTVTRINIRNIHYWESIRYQTLFL